MKLVLTLAALVGVAFGVWLVLHFGADQVGQAFLSAGWRGMLAISAVYFCSIILGALAWRALFPATPDVTQLLLWARWLRESAANLLSVVPAIGEAVAVRELTIHRVPLGLAVAATVVDLTMELASLLVFTLLAVVILLTEQPTAPAGWWLALGVLVCSGCVAGFIVAQHKGLFRFLETLPGRLGWTQAWPGSSDPVGIHTAIQDIYRHRMRVAVNFAIHLLAWVVGAGETWVGLWFMGHQVTVAEALVIESMLHALRTVAFMVPWAAGVQEGVYLVAGTLFGLSPQVGLGLSLLRRAREIVTGLPSIIIWQCLEPWRLWRNRSRMRSALIESGGDQ